jgi:hypothetical protein
VIKLVAKHYKENKVEAIGERPLNCEPSRALEVAVKFKAFRTPAIAVHIILIQSRIRSLKRN